MSARVGPPEYIRRVRNGWQARPLDDDGNRVNLGIYPTDTAARQAVRLFRAGRLRPLPKFVRRTKTDPVRYYWHVLQPDVNIRGSTLYDTPDAAARACRAFLTRLDGAFALAAVSQKANRTTSPKV